MRKSQEARMFWLRPQQDHHRRLSESFTAHGCSVCWGWRDWKVEGWGVGGLA